MNLITAGDVSVVDRGTGRPWNRQTVEPTVLRALPGSTDGGITQEGNSMAFVDIQNGLYNAVAEGLGQNRDSFALVQPGLPILNEQTLWNLFNILPPESLTNNVILSGGNQFFSNYSGTMAALQPGVTVDIERDIGAANWASWVNYLMSLNPTPTIDRFPDLFFRWAFLNAPAVANIGASDYAAILLDPISSAQAALLPYTPVPGPNSRPPAPVTWMFGYNDLVQQLQNAPAMSFAVTSTTMDTDVSNTWTSGRNSGFFGLWGGSNFSSTQSVRFSESRFELNASFAHVLAISSIPGGWYSSSAWGQAYANRGNPPWRPGVTQWGNVFGPSGNSQRYTVNLLVADTMNVTVTANTGYSEAEQQIIQNNSGAGLWPFYTSSSGGGGSSEASFNDAGDITIDINTMPGVPVVIGCNIFGIDRYVGHQLTALRGPAARQLVAQ